MPRISKKKKDKISEQILHHLYVISPQAQFTSQIAEELARDEEFIKSLLTDLKKNNFVLEVNKNSSGKEYLKRQRWRLSDKVFSAYKGKQ